MHIPEAELLEEEAELTQGSGDAGKTSVLRRRRRTYSRTLQEHMKPGKQYSADSDQQSGGTMGRNISIYLSFYFLFFLYLNPKSLLLAIKY